MNAQNAATGGGIIHKKMAKRVFIIHGWEGNPSEPMLQWLKKNMEKEGYNVIVPEMPNADKPEIKAWVSHITKVVKKADKETFFIGHSMGCQGILRFLETLESEKKVGGIVMIAPWMHLDEKILEEEGKEVIEIAKPWMETPINWDKIKKITKNIVAIFSDDDSYMPITEKKIFKEKLNAKIIIEHNKGHFSIGDNIKEIPSALEELKRMN